MYLDPDEEKILAGEKGETRQKMLELLVALGKVFGAERLVRIRSAQVSGASYKTIGEYGLAWLSSLDARAVVPAVLNPIGMPRLDAGRKWVSIPVFAERQQAVIAAYETTWAFTLNAPALPITCMKLPLATISHGRNHQRSVTQIRLSGPGQTGKADRVRLLPP